MNEMEQMNATQQFSGNVTIRFYSWDFGQEIFCRGLFSRANKEVRYIKARAEPSSARPQEAVRGECGDNRVVL